MALPNAFDASVAKPSESLQPALFTTRGQSPQFLPVTPTGPSAWIYADKLVMAAEAPTHCRASKMFTVATLGATHNTTGTITCLCFRRNSGVFSNGAPFAELPPAFTASTILLQCPGGDRDMVEILVPFVLHHDEGTQCRGIALSGKPSKEHVLNLLGRLTEEPHPNRFHSRVKADIGNHRPT